jgi:hypothetical protein
MSDQKPLILPAEDALRLGMLFAKIDGIKAKQALLERQGKDLHQAALAVLKRHGLGNADVGIVAGDGEELPLGTVYDPKTGQPLPAPNTEVKE